MKKIKKLFLTVILLALCLYCIIPFAGCKEEGDWIEVQSVSYTFETGETHSYESKCTWEISATSIIKEAYDLAPEDLKISFNNMQEYVSYFPSQTSFLSINRNEFINKANTFVNKTFYIKIIEKNYYYGEYELYKREIYKNYTLNYVRIQLLDNNILKIKANGKVIEVQPLLYNITYFED